MPDDKSRQWERDRRQRLSQSFYELHQLLPDYDPAVAVSKVDILIRAAAFIRHLQEERQAALEKGCTDKAQKEEITLLRGRLDELLSRTHLLAGLLHAADIAVPVGPPPPPIRPIRRVGAVSHAISREIRKAKRAAARKAKGLKRLATKIVPTADGEKEKLKSRKQFVQTRKNVSVVLAMSTPLHEISNKNGACCSVGESVLTKLSTVPSTTVSAVVAKKDATNIVTRCNILSAPIMATGIQNGGQSMLERYPQLSRLGPGTLILADGRMVSFPPPPPPQIIVNHPAPAVILMPHQGPTALVKTKRLVSLKPKVDTTITTFANKVPIPSLRVHQRQHGFDVRPSTAGRLQAAPAGGSSSQCMTKRILSSGNDTTKSKAIRVSKDIVTRNEILKKRKRSACIGLKRKIVKNNSTLKCSGLNKRKSGLDGFESGINRVDESNIKSEKVKECSNKIDSLTDDVSCSVEQLKLSVNNLPESSPVEDLDKMPHTNGNANTYTIDALCSNIDGEMIHSKKIGSKSIMGENKYVGDDLASNQVVGTESEMLKDINISLTHEKISSPVIDQIALVTGELTAGGTNVMVKSKENSVVDQLAENCTNTIPTCGNAATSRSRDLVNEKTRVTSGRVTPLTHEKSGYKYSSEQEENATICGQKCNEQMRDRNMDEKSNDLSLKETIEPSSSTEIPQANDKQNNTVLPQSSIADCTLKKVGTYDGPSVHSTTEHQSTENGNVVTTSRDLQHSDKNSFIPISHHSCLDDVRLSTDLSNDLFSSLHVSSGGHHPESISPTAAFLLAFPLVSTSKTSEMLAENENSESQHATPTTILQIGNIEPPVTELFHHTSSMMLESAASLFHTLKPVILKTASADLSKQFLNESDHSERFQHIDFHERFSFDNFQFAPESTTANKTDTVGMSTLSNHFRNNSAKVNNHNTSYEHRTPIGTHEGHCEYTQGIRNVNMECVNHSVTRNESHKLKSLPACSNIIPDSCNYTSRTQPPDQRFELSSNTVANTSTSESIHQQMFSAKPAECSTVSDVPHKDMKNLSNSIPVKRKLSHNSLSMHIVPKGATAVHTACPLNVSNNITMSKSSFANPPCLQSYAHMTSSQNATDNISRGVNSFLNVPHTTTSFCNGLNTATSLHSAPVISASKDHVTAATSIKQNTLVAHSPLQTTLPVTRYVGYMPPMTTHAANITDGSNTHNFPEIGKHLPSITHMTSMTSVSHIGPPPLQNSIECISASPSTKTYAYNYFSTSASYPIPSAHYTTAQSSMESVKQSQMSSNFCVSSWTSSIPVKHLDSNQTAPLNFHNPNAVQDHFVSQPKLPPQRTVPFDKKTKSDKAVSTNSPLKYVSDFQSGNASLNNRSNGGTSNQSIPNQYAMINQKLDSHNVKPKKVKSNLHPRPPVNWMTTPDLRPPLQDQLAPIIPDMMFAGQKDFDFSSANPSLSSNLSSFNIPPPGSNSQGVFVNPFSTVDLPLEATVFSEPNNAVAKHSTNVSNQQHYSWSPSKSTAPLLSHLDSQGLMIPSTLPTLVGDLALGTNTGPSTPADNSFRNFNLPNPTFTIETTAMKKQQTDQRSSAQRPDKDGFSPAGLNSNDLARSVVRNGNEFCAKDHQSSQLHNSGSFLSVSQLVDQAKTEGRPVSRRVFKNANGQSELKQNAVPGKRNVLEKQSVVKTSHVSNIAHFSHTKSQISNYPFKSSSGGTTVVTLPFREDKSGQQSFANQLNNTQWGDQGDKIRMVNNTTFKGGNYSAESLISDNHHPTTAQIGHESLELPQFHYNQSTVVYNQTQHKTGTEPSAGVSSGCNYFPSDIHPGDYSTHQNQYQNCFNFPSQTPVYPSVAPGYHSENEYQLPMDTSYLYPTSSNATRHHRGGHANRNGHSKPGQVAQRDRLPQTTPKALNTKHRDGSYPAPSTSLLQSYYMPSSSSHYANAATPSNPRTSNYQVAQHGTTSSPGSTASTTTLTNFNLSTIFPEINDKVGGSNGGSTPHFAAPFMDAPPPQPPYQGQAR